MKLYRRLSRTLFIISCVLFPDKKNGNPVEAAAIFDSEPLPTECRMVSDEKIRFYIADFNRALDDRGKFFLFFPNCLSAAGFFLLFRLKRTGFSNCRAWLEKGGIMIAANR